MMILVLWVLTRLRLLERGMLLGEVVGLAQVLIQGRVVEVFVSLPYREENLTTLVSKLGAF